MDPVEALVRKTALRDDVSAGERQALADLISEVRTYETGDIIVRAGVAQTNSQLLMRGVAARSKVMADGRCQITELHIAGDFVDLHSFLLKRLDHDIIALSPITMAIAPHERLKALTHDWPHLTRLLWMGTVIDAAIHRAWITSAGRRSAKQRIAHLICEILVRYEVVGLARDSRFPLPLTQAQLADACGLTPVHVNRTLQELRADGLLAWGDGMVEVRDRDRLTELAQFDPSYLALDHIPR